MVGVAGGGEAVAGGLAGARGRVGVLEAEADQFPVEVLGGLLRGGDERDVLPHHEREGAGQQRVVGASQHEGVHARRTQRGRVLPGGLQQFGAGGDAGLHELHEPRARDRGDLEVRGGRERVLVGAGPDGRLGADHADPARARGGHGAAHGGLDHLDHGDAVASRVALASVAQHGGRRGVARDHERLHAARDELVHDRQGQGPHLGDGPRAVRRVLRVAHVEDGLVGQLVHDRPGHGQPAHARVEHADRRGGVHDGAPAGHCSPSASPAPGADSSDPSGSSLSISVMSVSSSHEVKL